MRSHRPPAGSRGGTEKKSRGRGGRKLKGEIWELEAGKEEKI